LRFLFVLRRFSKAIFQNPTAWHQPRRVNASHVGGYLLFLRAHAVFFKTDFTGFGFEDFKRAI